MFVGERRDDLVRLGLPIDDLSTDEWLVAHHEARRIRRALAALSRYLRSRPGA